MQEHEDMVWITKTQYKEKIQLQLQRKITITDANFVQACQLQIQTIEKSRNCNYYHD